MQACYRLPFRSSQPNKFELLTSFHQIQVSRELACVGTGPGVHGLLHNSLLNQRFPTPKRAKHSREVQPRTSEIVSNCLRSSADQFAINGALSIPQAELCATNAECVTVAQLGSVEGLAKWLEARLPPGKNSISSWGVVPGTKHLANLWTELVDGEISLEDSQPPKRTVHVASVKVQNEAGLYLIESHQEMADGRSRPRNRPLAEKMRPGENVEDACRRGVFEELGPEMGARNKVEIILESYDRKEQERDSCSYPGLLTRYVLHTMVASITGLPNTDFSTLENEGHHPMNGASYSNGAATNGSATKGALSTNGCSKGSAVGVKTHFWRWVTEAELLDILSRR